MEKMTGASLDLTQENINRLKELFPEVLTEKKIDFEKLRLILGDEVETSPERYEFRWNGKNEAIKLSQTPSMGTLRPDKESSKNWDTTENLYIEGDNLEVLKLLQKSYFGKIKAIYIDPPYNTGQDFIYKDNFHDGVTNYKKITGQFNKTNPETNGRFHTDWLNMMYPRLKLARNLLTNDGVIFISIGESELLNLGKFCDDIFGETNRLTIFTRVTKKGSNNGNHFLPSTDYMLCYAKNRECCPNFYVPLTKEQLGRYNKTDQYEEIRGKYQEKGLYQSSLRHGGSRYPITCPDGEIVNTPNNMPWRWNEKTFLNNLEEDRVVFKKTSSSPLINDITGEQATWNIYTKVYLNERSETGLTPRNYSDEYPNSLSSRLLKELSIAFDYGKPLEFINFLINLQDKDAIVLDFFSGSATTAHSVMKLNSEDGGNRKFIMVQLPELVDENSAALKLGFQNICNIGQERIRRAGDKILEESNNKDLDIGFKVFKLDDSNIKTWDPGTKDLENTIFNSTQNLKDDRTQEDLLYELMLKMGIELTANVEEVSVGDKVIYNIQSGGLVICLENEITKDVIDCIPTLKSPFMEMKVVFKEYGFKSDADKLNAIQNLKQHGITDVRSV